MNSFTYDVQAEPDTVIRSLEGHHAGNVVESLLCRRRRYRARRLDRRAEPRVRKKKKRPFSGFSGALRLDLVVSKADAGSRVVGRFRLGSLALMFRSVYVVFFAVLGAMLAALTISQGRAFRRCHCCDLSSYPGPSRVQRVP